MNKLATLRLTAIFAAVHLAAAAGSLLLGFSLGMARFDSPETAAPSYAEAISSRLADVLFEPGQMIYRALHAGSSAPAMVQWLYFILNSALWGLVVATAVMWLRRPWRGRHVVAVILSTCIVTAASGIAVVTQPFVQAIASDPPAVDPQRLEAHTRHLSVDLYPRSYDQQRNIELAAQYITQELNKTGGRVDVQEVMANKAKYRNGIARFGPATGPVLVIGAHYDSHGDTPGADDNASGVAGLLELARLLGGSPPARAIELVAYTLEEPPYFRTGHMGSAWHARSLRAEGREVRLMLSLEMIGYFSDAPESQHYPVPAMSHLYSDQGNFIALVGRIGDLGAMRRAKALMSGATDLPVFSINAAPALQGIDFSDHLSYWNEGFPAIMVTDTAFLRNQNYHRAGDAYDKLDYVRMAKVVQGPFALSQRY